MKPGTQEERELLAAVPAALEGGLALLRWWRQADADDYRSVTTYPEAFVFNRPEDRSFGFFGDAALPGGPLAVNGNVQEMFYDEPKSPQARGGAAAAWMAAQIREFVLHYFMRVSDYRAPQHVPVPRPPPPPGLGFLSQCPPVEPERGGFGFSQWYYKTPGGEVGAFREAQRDAVVDLRRLGHDFEWIVLRNPIFDFRFELKPFGGHGPQMVLPLSDYNFLVASRDFVVDEVAPEPGILGRFGLGYAFVKRPEPSPLAYGPGQLQPAFERLVWTVHESGEVTVRATFVANQPTAVLDLALDPFVWGFQLSSVLFSHPGLEAAMAPFKRFYHSLPWSRLRFDPVFPSLRLLNWLTAGQAAERFCLSREQLMKDFLFLHFMQHYRTILASLQTWRQIPDWLDRDALPAFVVDGRSA